MTPNDSQSAPSISATATILVVDDTPANISLLATLLEGAGYAIAAASDGPSALKLVELDPPDLVLMDVMMPGMDGYEACRRLRGNPRAESIPVLFITAREDVQSRIQAFAAGGVDYIVKPFHAEEVLARVSAHLRIHHLTRDLARNNERLQREISGRVRAEEALDIADQRASLISEREIERWGIPGFVGESATFRKILGDIRQLQNFEATNVLITGESGTGKELVARAIHFGGGRPNRPFLPVNCSAIPLELAESNFFGHVRGAFTGAVSDRKGYFHLADGGTLFLDELGDMPLSIQAKLLRVLEDGLITPVGSTEPREVRVRIISATHQDLAAKIRQGTFREDLFYRLAEYTVVSPPLRDRVDDIPLLANHFLGLLAGEYGVPVPGLEPEALALLQAHSFPGNIRQLRNALMRSMIEASGGTIRREHLHGALAISRPSVLGAGSGGVPAARSTAGEDIARDLLLRMKRGDGTFWEVVQEPYLNRDLNRQEARSTVALALGESGGSYKKAMAILGLPETDYTRFMDFLRHNRIKPVE